MEESQLNAIKGLYLAKKELSLIFSASLSDQADAQQLLQLYGLDRTARASLENRWNVQWSMAWKLGTQGDRRQRILLQWYACSILLVA